MNRLLKFLASLGIMVGAFVGFANFFGRWCKEKTSKQYVTIRNLEDYEN